MKARPNPAMSVSFFTSRRFWQWKAAYATALPIRPPGAGAGRARPGTGGAIASGCAGPAIPMHLHGEARSAVGSATWRLVQTCRRFGLPVGVHRRLDSVTLDLEQDASLSLFSYRCGLQYLDEADRNRRCPIGGFLFEIGRL